MHKQQRGRCFWYFYTRLLKILVFNCLSIRPKLQDQDQFLLVWDRSCYKTEVLDHITVYIQCYIVTQDSVEAPRRRVGSSCSNCLARQPPVSAGSARRSLQWPARRYRQMQIAVSVTYCLVNDCDACDFDSCRANVVNVVCIWTYSWYLHICV